MISRYLVSYLVDRMTAIPVSKLAQLVEGDKFHDLVPNDRLIILQVQCHLCLCSY